jgi:hypothetical protein
MARIEPCPERQNFPKDPWPLTVFTTKKLPAKVETVTGKMQGTSIRLGLLHKESKSQVTKVSIATGYRVDDRSVRVRVPIVSPREPTQPPIQ